MLPNFFFFFFPFSSKLRSAEKRNDATQKISDLITFLRQAGSDAWLIDRTPAGFLFCFFFVLFATQSHGGSHSATCARSGEGFTIGAMGKYGSPLGAG